MKLITTRQLFDTLREEARRRSVMLPSLAETSRPSFFRALAGRPITSEVASKLIVAARQFIDPEIEGIIDGSGRRHIAADFIERAQAEMARLQQALAAAQRETALLRRITRTRFLTSL